MIKHLTISSMEHHGSSMISIWNKIFHATIMMTFSIYSWFLLAIFCRTHGKPRFSLFHIILPWTLHRSLRSLRRLWRRCSAVPWSSVWMVPQCRRWTWGRGAVRCWEIMLMDSTYIYIYVHIYIHIYISIHMVSPKKINYLSIYIYMRVCVCFKRIFMDLDEFSWIQLGFNGLW